jgi:hypothetical protein
LVVIPFLEGDFVMEDMLKEMNKTEEEIRNVEQQFYFIDFFDSEKVRWYRNPWVPKEELGRWLIQYLTNKSYHNLRVWRESDLSIEVARDGEQITLREMFFGSSYQFGRDFELVNYFDNQVGEIEL